MAGNLAGQAHAQAHAIAPDFVPAPSTAGTAGSSGAASMATGEVDRSGVIEPDDQAEKAKFEKLFDSRPTADELQDKGILKGKRGVFPALGSEISAVNSLQGLGGPLDSLAGKRADLEKAMTEVKPRDCSSLFALLTSASSEQIERSDCSAIFSRRACGKGHLILSVVVLSASSKLSGIHR